MWTPGPDGTRGGLVFHTLLAQQAEDQLHRQLLGCNSLHLRTDCFGTRFKRFDDREGLAYCMHTALIPADG